MTRMRAVHMARPEAAPHTRCLHREPPMPVVQLRRTEPQSPLAPCQAADPGAQDYQQGA